MPYISSLALSVPVVTNNGSEVWTVDGTLLERHLLRHSDIHFLHQLAMEYGCYFWTSAVGHTFKGDAFPRVIEDYEWLKFGFFSKEDTVMQEIWQRLKDYGQLELSASATTNIEVNAQGITKATGLQSVCRILQWDAPQVVTIGDGLNDVPMFEWSAQSFAMDNAPFSVKQKAKLITGHHLDHGVAQAIHKIVDEM
jgi:HAD superfamily hydrolase (TIGR01484 family)